MRKPFSTYAINAIAWSIIILVFLAVALLAGTGLGKLWHIFVEAWK